MKKVLFVLFFPVFLFIACTNNSTNTGTAENAAANEQLEQKAWDDMMVIHDEVMPKMSEINGLTRDFKNYVEANRETISPAYLERISVALTELEDGDEGMMNWMNGIKQLDNLRGTLDHNAIMVYLKEQAEIIAQVKEKMLSSIENGKALLTEMQAE